jgi:glycosyltransferase involved in cell wall biosynthesis
MRIVAIHNLQTGGARRRLENQLAHLGHDVQEVCLSTATPVTETPLVIPVHLASQRLPKAMRPPTRYLDLAMLEAGWRRLRDTVSDLHADVMYLNPCRFLQAPDALAEGLPPAVYFCDEPRRVDTEPDAAGRVNPRTARLYAPIYRRMRSLDRRVVAGVSLIATNSRYTASEIERVYGRRSTVVTLGVADADSWTGADRHDYLLSVGTLIPGKGHEIVIRAAAAAHRRRPVLIIAPRAEERENARLQAIAADLNVELQIRLAVSDRELSHAYSTAFVTLYLAEREPLGLVSLEAQAHGCPVIVSDEGGLPETILDGVTGWACPRDPVQVASLLNRLEQSDIAQPMSSSARAYAQTWTWRRSASQLQVLLDAAADGP